jgi:hypothetical protein
MNTNQFRMTQVAGSKRLSNSFSHAIDCLYNPNAGDSTTLVPGEAVKLVDLGTNDSNDVLPIVDKRSSDTDTALFGVVCYGTTQGKYKPGEIVSVAIDGDCINLKASTVLNRGALVTPDFANPGNVKLADNSAADVAVLGKTIDKAANAGELVGVLIKTEILAEA